MGILNILLLVTKGGFSLEKVSTGLHRIRKNEIITLKKGSKPLLYRLQNYRTGYEQSISDQGACGPIQCLLSRVEIRIR